MAKNTMEKKASFSLSAAAAGREPMRTNTARKNTTSEKAENSTEKDYERFCFICDTVLMKKIKIAAQSNGVKIRAVMEMAMGEWLDKYEAKNGPIIDLAQKNVNELV